MKARHYILIGILLLGLGLRLVRLSWPAHPVFDEQHFATYAADYVKDRAFFDIHPPLGKLIYAAVLSVASNGELNEPTDFVTFNTTSTQPAAGGTSSTKAVIEVTGIPFGQFPYVPLRATSAAFGVLLILAFYWFLRSAGVGETGALLGAFFVAVDNALVLQTKLILMDGMYLAFGFMALALWFRRPRMPIAAGVMFALSLGVKLIGVVFIGPVIIEYAILSAAGNKEATKRLVRFSVAVAISFAAIVLLNFAFFSPARIIAFAKSIGTQFPSVSSPVLQFLVAVIATTLIPWTGYLQGGSGPSPSAWYQWPVMQMPMYYYDKIVLIGDPVLWFGSAIAVAFAIALLVRHIRRRLAARKSARDDAPAGASAEPSMEGENRTLILLLGGYAAALLPFFTFVRRETFLYHYFPALLFAFGILAWLLSRWRGFGDISALSRRQRFILAMIVVLVGAGFLAVAPFTYGL